MKNLGITFFSLLAALPLAAASNCVSRVDKNLNKTTTEKINYCLEEDQTPVVEEKKTEIVWSDTYSVEYPKKKASQNTTPNTVNDPQEKQPVRMGYMNRRTYPSFRNDTLPSLNGEEANQTAMDALKTQQPAVKPKPTAQKKKKPAKKVSSPVKPARKMNPEELNKAIDTMPAPITQASVAPASTQTAAREQQIQQAQALQNDPLAANPTDNGAVPNEFLDDGVMGPADFGYNATDPAMQQ